GQPAHEHHPGHPAHPFGAGPAGGRLRAQGVHPGHDLGRQLLRPMGGGARQGPRRPHRRRADRRGEWRRPRQLHRRADPPLPPGPGPEL
ncbi:MAG: Glucose-6-phosphate isomerase, partial [uncultured Acidimicrobiales bacterium]